MTGIFNKYVDVKVATYEDIVLLAPVLRQADLNEIKAATGQSGLEALQEGYNLTPLCLYATYDGQPLALFGVAPDKDVPTRGVPWLLGSDLIEKCPVTFLRYSRNWLRTLGEGYQELRNFVKADHHESISYLSRLGFSFADPVQLGPNNDDFLPFSKILVEGE